MTTRDRILLESRLWRTEKEALDRSYFKNLTRRSKSSILWIESFGNVATPSEIANTDADEIVVYRNVGGQCKPEDASLIATLEDFMARGNAEYIVVCAHSMCHITQSIIAGRDTGVYAARWTDDMRELYDQHADEWTSLNPRQKERKFSELHVQHQLQQLGRMEALQRAWSEGSSVSLLGLYLDLHKGDLHEIAAVTKAEVTASVVHNAH